MSSRYFRTTSHVVPCQHIREYYRATANSQNEVLQLAIKQYVPIDRVENREGDVTVIAAHAAGFFKELYEPLFDDLYVALKSHGVNLRGIWIADIASHGASSVLNEGKLGNEPCWDDHARDLLHMINVFRDEMPPPLVGIGHSMGAQNIVQLAMIHPRLFSTVVCIEPILNKQLSGMNFSAAYGLAYRKDVWSSLEEAMAESRRSPLHKTWDGRVMERWNNHAFRNLPTLLYPELPEQASKIDSMAGKSNAVTLSTSKHHNSTSYARAAFPAIGEALQSFHPNRQRHIGLTKEEHTKMHAPVYRPESVMTFQQLHSLRPPCFYIHGKTSLVSSASPQGRADKLEVTGVGMGGSGGLSTGRVQESIIDGGGHFIVFESPAAVARETSQWLKIALDEWRAESQLEEHEWKQIGLREKAMVDERWMYWMKKHYGRSSNPSNGKKQKTAKL